MLRETVVVVGGVTEFEAISNYLDNHLEMRAHHECIIKSQLT